MREVHVMYSMYDDLVDDGEDGFLERRIFFLNLLGFRISPFLFLFTCLVLKKVSQLIF